MNLAWYFPFNSALDQEFSVGWPETCQAVLTAMPLDEPISVPQRTESRAKRARLPQPAVEHMLKWALNAISPHPSRKIKMEMAEKTDITFDQVNNWFHNYRKRYWKRR